MAGYRGRQGQGHSGARPVSLALSTKGIHRGQLYICSRCVPSLRKAEVEAETWKEGREGKLREEEGGER